MRERKREREREREREKDRERKTERRRGRKKKEKKKVRKKDGEWREEVIRGMKLFTGKQREKENERQRK